MAKLSAHGEELIRLEKRVNLEAEHDSEDGTWVTKYLAFMADGRLLTKQTWINVSEFTGKARTESRGWKLAPKTFKKLIAENSREQAIEKIRDAYASTGWSEVAA